jgi:hypothetical protein
MHIVSVEVLTRAMGFVARGQPPCNEFPLESALRNTFAERCLHERIVLYTSQPSATMPEQTVVGQ